MGRSTSPASELNDALWSRAVHVGRRPRARRLHARCSRLRGVAVRAPDRRARAVLAPRAPSWLRRCCSTWPTRTGSTGRRTSTRSSTRCCSCAATSTPSHTLAQPEGAGRALPGRRDRHDGRRRPRDDPGSARSEYLAHTRAYFQDIGFAGGGRNDSAGWQRRSCRDCGLLCAVVFAVLLAARAQAQEVNLARAGRGAAANRVHVRTGAEYGFVAGVGYARTVPVWIGASW